jgi:DNA-binding response OmpR family regulator
MPRVSQDVRILVVEDEVKLAGHLRRALTHDGHDPQVVHDGIAALNEVRNGTYDLILLDVELPGLDGLEVLKQLRASANRTRVIMLTARAKYRTRSWG